MAKKLTPAQKGAKTKAENKSKATKKPVAKKAPAKKKREAVDPCPDCEVPRRDNDETRSSGLLDHETICVTCNGSGRV